jgi:hypothetical protein
MDRRYQVFISSTYRDLVEERREVIQALLEMDCLPAGMEMFPAADEDQWSLIESVIDQSDYYVVIVGGRYGSMTEAGLSYTEKEYDYAVASGIPVLGFIHADPSDIAAKNTDMDAAVQAKLEAFRTKVQTKMIKTYSSPHELGSVVSRGMMRLMKTTPREGWVRGSAAMTPEVRAEVAELRAQLAELQRSRAEEAAAIGTLPDPTLDQGDDELLVHFKYFSDSWAETRQWNYRRNHSWNSILRALGPMMVDEASDVAIKKRFNAYLLDSISGEKDFTSIERPAVEADIASWEKVMVQLRALGFIRTGQRKRTVSDKATYWVLTETGDHRLVELLALRKTEPKPRSAKAAAKSTA